MRIVISSQLIRYLLVHRTLSFSKTDEAELFRDHVSSHRDLISSHAVGISHYSSTDSQCTREPIMLLTSSGSRTRCRANDKFRIIIAVQFIVDGVLQHISDRKVVAERIIHFINVIHVLHVLQILIYCWYGNEVKVPSSRSCIPNVASKERRLPSIGYRRKRSLIYYLEIAYANA